MALVSLSRQLNVPLMKTADLGDAVKRRELSPLRRTVATCPILGTVTVMYGLTQW